jgi:hypothetical protein
MTSMSLTISCEASGLSSRLAPQGTLSLIVNGTAWAAGRPFPPSSSDLCRPPLLVDVRAVEGHFPSDLTPLHQVAQTVQAFDRCRSLAACRTYYGGDGLLGMLIEIYPAPVCPGTTASAPSPLSLAPSADHLSISSTRNACQPTDLTQTDIFNI